MRSVTPTFLGAANLSGHEARWVLELSQLGIYYSSHVENFGRAAALDEGLAFNGSWRLNGLRPPYELRIAQDGVGAVLRSLDQRARPGRVGNLSIRLVNTDGLGGTFYDIAIDNTIARLLMGYRDLPYEHYTLLFTGAVDNTQETDRHFTLTIIESSLRFRRELNTPLGSRFYPGTPQRNRGKFIPMILGRQTDIEAIQILGAAQATLAFTANAGDTEISVVEFGANFPPSGDIEIGNDAGVSYTAREIRQREGVSYLTLTGVTGITNPDDPPGSVVVLVNFALTYLVGYETGEVTEVRDDDGIIDPANYTVTQTDGGADLPTTIITFDVGFTPAGPVLIDADGKNIDDPAVILNGGFETGTLADWTVEAGGTGSVLTTDPLEGTYLADIEGLAASYRRLSQTITTRRGAFYAVRFFYRDVIPTPNLFSNGDFATGDTTGWTLVDDPVYFGATFAVSDYENTQRVVFSHTANGPYGQGFRDGSLYAYRYQMYQDVTTIIAQDYRVTAESVLGNVSFGGEPYQGALTLQGGINNTNVTLFQNRTWYSLQTRIAVGDAGSPTAIANQTFTAPRSTGSVVVTPISLDFTAAAVTTRITFEVISQSSRVALGAALGPLIVYQTSIERTSLTRFEVGSSATPDEVLGLDLDKRYSWRQQDITFQAIAGQTQLSFASQYIGGVAVGSHIDSVTLLDAGRNPADAIAYVIDTFIPEMERDTESFQVAFEKLRGWQFGAYISAPGNSEQLLERMSFQCMSRLRRSADGKVSLIVSEFSGRPPVTFDHTNILVVSGNTLTTTRETLDNIYTKFTIWFGRASEEQDDQQGFQGSVYADPESTSDPLEPLSEYCRNGERVYNGIHEFTYRAEMIRDLDTAHRWLRYLVKTRTVRHFDVEFSTSHRYGIELEEGDPVMLRHSHFATGLPFICQVLSTSINDLNVRLKVRTIRLAGVFEPWEDNRTRIANLKLFEPWSS